MRFARRKRALSTSCFTLRRNRSNVDYLFRRFIESMAEICGAAAGHIFLLSEEGRKWRLKASTAQAASPKTQVIVAASGPVRTRARSTASHAQARVDS